MTGIKVDTIKKRSQIDKWKTPARRMALKEGRAAPLTNGVEISKGGDLSIPFNEQALAPFRDKLLDAAKAGPEPFRKAVQDAARVAMAESIAVIPLPRTIAEWKAMQDILEKAEKSPDGKPTGFVRHAGAVFPQPIEAEVIPPAGAPTVEDGFTI
jgi:hypothetical protein